MKLLKYYLKKNFMWLLTIVLCLIIMIMVIDLNQVPIGEWGYAALLCLFLILVMGGIDFLQYYQKHKRLVKSQKVIRIAVDALDLPGDQLEEDYQELLRIVHEDKISNVKALEQKKTGMMEYYSMWVHQIKTPIAAMRLLLNKQENEENQELAEELFRIEQYVEMALQYSRLDADSTDLVIKTYSLDAIVREAVRKYARLFVRKKLQLNFEPLQAQVLTDEKWLQFVIEQLLSNAIKYTAKGSISIYMSAEDEQTLVIADTGIGIRSEDLPRICEKGYTGYNGHSDKSSTGIGLYLSRRALKQLSHTIRIESELGVGTKVYIGLGMKQVEIE